MTFDLYSPITLITIYFATEFLVLRFKRADKYADRRDDGSLRVIITVIWVSLVLGRIARFAVPQAQLEVLRHIATAGVLLFFTGLIVRWAPIIHLGRFFTTEVAITTDHELIQSGFYRFVRHPSYMGLLLMFLGVGICSGNMLTLLVIEVPIFFALRYRMQIEEAVLLDAFGERYASYMNKTKRLIPLVY